MSKHETQLTRRFWMETGGTLVEEFPVVKGTPYQGRRLLDGLIVLNGDDRIAKPNEIDIANQDVIVIQTKNSRLGMYLLGQALFSKHLIEPFKPRSIRSVAICSKTDAVLQPLATQYGIEVVEYINRIDVN